MADEEDTTATPPAAARSPFLPILIAVVATAVLLGGGGFAALYFLGIFPAHHAKAASHKKSAPSAEQMAQKAVFTPLDPSFTVNFDTTGSNTTLRYLQVSVQAMSTNPKVPAEIKKFMPIIRNDLTMLFSSQSAIKLQTLKGKEDLRREALDTVRKVLAKETGKPGVDAIYFTSFVMQ